MCLHVIDFHCSGKVDDATKKKNVSHLNGFARCFKTHLVPAVAYVGFLLIAQWSDLQRCEHVTVPSVHETYLAKAQPLPRMPGDVK